jgi:hypothetical protein
VDDKPKRWWQQGRRATFLQWCAALGIGVVLVFLLAELYWQDAVVNGIPSWYVAYERWKRRHGLSWLPF